MAERYYDADEKPFVAECEKLAKTLSAKRLDSLGFLVRYRDSYNHFKLVRRYFAELVEHGLADDSTKQATAKGRCLYRFLIHESMEAFNKEVDEQFARQNGNRTSV